MMKRTIRLTESDIVRIVKRIIKEQESPEIEGIIDNMEAIYKNREKPTLNNTISLEDIQNNYIPKLSLKDLKLLDDNKRITVNYFEFPLPFSPSGLPNIKNLGVKWNDSFNQKLDKIRVNFSIQGVGGLTDPSIGLNINI